MVTASDDLLCRIAPNDVSLLFLLYEWPSFSTDMYSTDIMENEFGPIPMTFTEMLLNKSCIKLNKCYVFLYSQTCYHKIVVPMYLMFPFVSTDLFLSLINMIHHFSAKYRIYTTCIRVLNMAIDIWLHYINQKLIKK